MSMVPIVENILKEKTTPSNPDLVKMQNRYNDLVKRGIIQEERPKTFGEIAYPIDCKNKHINYSLSEKRPY